MYRLFTIIFVLVVGLLFSGCDLIYEKDHPTDAEMIETFKTHRNEFEMLLRMFREDRSLGRVAYEFTRTSNFFEQCEEADCWRGKEIEVTEKRLAEYRKLFSTIGLESGMEGYGKKKSIAFLASSKGLSITGSAKGYMYTTEKPHTIVDDLDRYWSPDGKSFMAFRYIEENWYMFFDYED